MLTLWQKAGFIRSFLLLYTSRIESVLLHIKFTRTPLGIPWRSIDSFLYASSELHVYLYQHHRTFISTKSCKDSCTTVFDSLTSPTCAVFFFKGTLILYLPYLLPLPRMMPTAHKDTREMVINHQVLNDDLTPYSLPVQKLDASLANHTVTPRSSSGRPIRPIGFKLDHFSRRLGWLSR